ncbi:hypothetical protein [Amycolatopsis silviterrae]|uniref:Prevent-host-death family protein n=1 Tax=Amycolatopsis silviterrae TaxID=1656914 RepID=A0ABW5GZH5_9PSEU
MRVPEVNLSELSLRPRQVVDQLERSPSRSVRIRRREKDKPDLLLVTAERAEQVAAAVSAAVTLLVELMRRNTETAETAEVLPAAFPWARYLSAAEVRTFVGELAETLERAESLGNPVPVATLVAKWKQTAEAHADPALAEILRRNDHKGQSSGQLS